MKSGAFPQAETLMLHSRLPDTTSHLAGPPPHPQSWGTPISLPGPQQDLLGLSPGLRTHFAGETSRDQVPCITSFQQEELFTGPNAKQEGLWVQPMGIGACLPPACTDKFLSHFKVIHLLEDFKKKKRRQEKFQNAS